MWIDRLTNSRTTHALELAAQFAEQRQSVLAENVANVDTPGYRTKRLDAAAFQASLREALQRGATAGSGSDAAGGRLDLRESAQIACTPAGSLRTTPVEEPADNVLFQDGTNASLEQLVADTNANALQYEMAMNLLKGRLDGLLRAIRGRVS